MRLFQVSRIGILLAMILSACATAPENTEERTELQNDADAAMKNFQAKDPSLSDFLGKAYGYAIFPNIGKGAVGIGGAYGQGEVYEQGNHVGYAAISQGSLGVALGGQTYSELVIFQNKSVLDDFKGGDWAFSAQASAVASHNGAASTTIYQNGVAVFFDVTNGLMGEASLGEQKFSYQPR